MGAAPEPPVSAELLACNCGTGCAGCVLMGDSSSLPVPPSSCEVWGSARALEHDRCTGQTDSTQQHQHTLVSRSQIQWFHSPAGSGFAHKL